jgi:hypothetical protein
MVARVAASLLAASVLLVSTAPGQDKHDRAVLNQALREVINTGADLFNLQADYAGCYRVYQGSLISVKPFLDPKTRTEIDTALAEAEKKASFAERAYRLREMIDKIRGGDGVTPMKTETHVDVVRPGEELLRAMPKKVK